mgnify:CR=1 FL=1|tara:strand:- start:12296 stop:12967 length:672 start_codon:yes stop_codon:yes gene_type:complete
MNFITATIELRSHIPDQINAYGLPYRGADAVIPSGNSTSETRVRLLCYDAAGEKLAAFQALNPGSRILISGQIYFGDDTSQPLDIMVTTIESNIPQNMYCNHVILGSAFFTTKKPTDKGPGKMSFLKIGCSLDNSDTATWLYMEVPDGRKKKLTDRYRSGRSLCIQGYIREYRKEGDVNLYRAIVASDFTTRKDKPRSNTTTPPSSTAAGYEQIDPDPAPTGF